MIWQSLNRRFDFIFGVLLGYAVASQHYNPFWPSVAYAARYAGICLAIYVLIDCAWGKWKTNHEARACSGPSS